jgi:hypothetical protein
MLEEWTDMAFRAFNLLTSVNDHQGKKELEDA